MKAVDSNGTKGVGLWAVDPVLTAIVSTKHLTLLGISFTGDTMT